MARATSDPEVGTAVKALRVRAGLTQAAVAEQMRALRWPWRQSTVSEVETGRQPLRLVEAVDLAGVLGAQITDLIKDPLTRLIRELEAADPLRRSRFSIEGRLRALRVLDETRRGRAPAEYVDNGVGLRRSLAHAMLEVSPDVLADVLTTIGVPRATQQELAALQQRAAPGEKATQGTREKRFADRLWRSLVKVLPPLGEIEEWVTND